MRHASSLLKSITLLTMVGALAFCAQVSALGLSDLSNKDTASGLKEALSRGVDVAVGQLGKTDGFMGDSRVRIPLPESARAAEKMMRTLGMKKQADELIETMNRAAEMAEIGRASCRERVCVPV